MIDAIYQIVVAISLLGAWLYTATEKEKQIADERSKWHVERQKLLDRIQAGSFAELKQQEVRVIKAQSGEKEPPKLEPM